MIHFGTHEYLDAPALPAAEPVFHDSPVGVFTCTESGRLLTVNRRLRTSLGLREGQWIWRALTPASRNDLFGRLRDRSAGDERNDFVVALAGARARDVWVVLAPFDFAGERCFRGAVVEMGSAAAPEGRRDDLTGLITREAAICELEHRLDDQNESPVAVMFIDLNDFKDINDTYGHEAGDDVLRAVAWRLESSVRADDTVARLGGDEFLVLTTAGRSGDDALALAHRIQRAIAETVAVGEVLVSPRASIGVATDRSDGMSAAQLVREADLAMYEAKAGKHLDASSVAIASKSSRERFARRRRVERDLEVARTKGEMRFVYQPVRRLRDSAVLGAEAFLRWTHPELGAVSPREILNVSTNASDVRAFTQWTLGEVADEWARVRGRCPSLANATVCINVEPQQVLLDGYVELHREALRANGLDRGDVVLDVQEWDEERGECVCDALGVLADEGIPVVLDYFGVRYNALEYAQTVAVHGLKVSPSLIDSMSVPGMPSAVAARSIIEGLVTASAGLGVTPIAAGLERADQIAMCLELGIEMGQGFALGRPVPIAAFESAERRALHQATVAPLR